jgi:carbonic anhydrase
MLWSFSAPATASEPAHAAQTGAKQPASAHARLEQGNERFVSGHSAAHDYVHDRAGLVKGQQPFAIVLACADSRVSPEIVFDESLGQLFVIRVAGNVVDADVLGSAEYAAEHLHTHYLLILGHDACGAVSAAVSGGDAPANVATLVQRIAPAVEAAKARGGAPASLVDAAVRENVRLQMAQVAKQSTLLAKMASEKELQIEGGVYHLDSGRVEWLRPAEATAGH